MYGEIVAQIAIVTFAVLVIWAAITDARQFIIPNRITVTLLAVYPAYVLASGNWADVPLAIAAACIMLGLGAVAFVFNQMGGGDVKLMTACVLWAGPQFALGFVFVTLIAGGAIALALLIWARMARFWPVASQSGWAMAVADEADSIRRNIPYGVAIACGGLFVALSLWRGV